MILKCDVSDGYEAACVKSNLIYVPQMWMLVLLLIAFFFILQAFRSFFTRAYFCIFLHILLRNFMCRYIHGGNGKKKLIEIATRH